MEKPSLGDQELEVLRYVTDHAPITVREVTQQFGEPHGLARTTILTVMERLRRKGYLTREQADGAFRYRPCMAKRELLRTLVRGFADKVLGGSVEPFVAYLEQDAQLTDQELDELRRLVSRLESERREDRR